VTRLSLIPRMVGIAWVVVCLVAMNGGSAIAQQGGLQQGGALQGGGVAAAKLVLRGTVVNAVTHEPIGRAVVTSPDDRFAVMTDERGRFEMRFKEKKSAPPAVAASGGATPGGIGPGSGGSRTVWFSNGNGGVGSTSTSSNGDGGAQTQQVTVDRPDALTARRVGFLSTQLRSNPAIPVAPDQEEVTIPLMPEARVVGHVTLADGEGARGMQVALYRHTVQDGRAQWLHSGQAEVKSDGEFRIAELEAGEYKLFSLELNDRDPVTSDPRGQQFGYPPDYYPGAADFGTGALIHLAAGETFQATLTPERRKYYPVRIGMGNGPPQRGGMVPQAEVWKDGHPGPGYTLGYDYRDGSIGGALPDGNYLVKVTSPGDIGLTGLTNLGVNGGPAGGTVALMQGSVVGVHVSEEFGNSGQAQQVRQAVSGAAQQNQQAGGGQGAPQSRMHLRDYVQFMLWSTDEFTFRRQLMAQQPSDPEAEGLEIPSVPAGEYRVQVQTPIGYVASVRSGGTDLQKSNLVVGAGASVAPIEVVLRDDGAEVDGSVVEIANRSHAAASGQTPGMSPGYVYLVPEGERVELLKETFVQPNGDFQFGQLPPGSYRVLAFERQRNDLEFSNEDAMRKYGAQTITVGSGQKMQIKVSLNTE
jgi:hypothetical protein